MKRITSQAVMALMEPKDWDGLHDVVLDAAELDESPPREVLELVLHRLDEGVLDEAMQWGFSDTVVRDSAYQFVEEAVQEHGSLSAWLALPPANGAL